MKTKENSKKVKLSLDDLQVQSFVTTIDNQNNVKGGNGNIDFSESGTLWTKVTGSGCTGCRLCC